MRMGDGSLGALVCVEVTGTRGAEKSVSALLGTGDGNFEGDGNLA